MKRIFTNSVLSILIFLIGISITKAQLTVQGGFTPQQLVQTLLGPNVNVSNIVYTGDPNASGKFDGTTSNLGIDSGIILTSGLSAGAAGANTTSAISNPLGLPGDSLLDNVIGGTTYDACVLEFDFVPLTTVVTFRFVMGSEEYNEWVGSFNDVFGFFVSGPGIVGQQNIALIPTTTTPVSISNVNNGNSGGQSTGPCMNCAYFFDNWGGLTVQYDGFTVPITAQITVTPCQTYHMKLAVADVSDQAYDTGVFLEAGSFSGGTPIHIQSAISTPAIMEGCDSSMVTFTFDSILPTNDTVWIMPFGSASNGIDYNSLPWYVVAQPGDTSITFPITSIPDNIAEGTENLLLYFVYYSNCGTVFDSLKLDILDIPPVVTTVSNDTSVCIGSTVTLNGSSTGGFGNLTYAWDNSATTQSITVTPTQTTTYTLIVNDECTRADTSVITVSVINIPPLLSLSNDTTICPGNAVTLTANATGGGNITYLWNNASTDNSITVSPAQTTIYSVSVSNNCNLTATSQVTVTVINQPPVLTASNDTTICSGTSITLVANASGGSTPYYFIWDNGISGTSNTVSPTQQTTYTIIVSDKCNYSDTSHITISVLPEPTLAFSFTDSLCMGDAATIKYTGDYYTGSSINWDFDNGDIQSGTGVGPYNVVWNVVGTHIVLFNIAYPNCYNKTDSIVINEKSCELIIPNIITPNGDGTNDMFVIKGLENYPGSSLKIFSRWGTTLLDSGNYQNDWDANGQPDGVYFYLLNVAGKESFKGTVSVLRKK